MTDYAISLHAPWAWAIMHAGKDVENRSTNFPRRRNGHEVLGRVWVHASLWPGNQVKERSRFDYLDEELSKVEVASPYNSTTLRNLDDLRGHVVGSVVVYGYQMPEPSPPASPWYVPGSLAIMVRDPIPLARPVQAKGALGWWTPSDDVLEQLRRAS